MVTQSLILKLYFENVSQFSKFRKHDHSKITTNMICHRYQ